MYVEEEIQYLMVPRSLILCQPNVDQANKPLFMRRVCESAVWKAWKLVTPVGIYLYKTILNLFISVMWAKVASKQIFKDLAGIILVS